MNTAIAQRLPTRPLPRRSHSVSILRLDLSSGLARVRTDACSLYLKRKSFHR